MSTEIKPELSEKNPYWIPRHRYYELKHFCLQYQAWQKILQNMTYLKSIKIDTSTEKDISDPTSKLAIMETSCLERIKMVQTAAKETDKIFCDFILKAVTQGLTYNVMKMKYDVPCGKDIWYEMYRRFFWILDQIRD